MTRTLEEAELLPVTQEDWVNDKDVGHRNAMNNIDACLSVTVLSYEEAVKSYLRDRGIGIDKSGELRFHAHRLNTRPATDHAGLVERLREAGDWSVFSPMSPERMEAFSGRREDGWIHADGIFPATALSTPSPLLAEVKSHLDACNKSAQGSPHWSTEQREGAQSFHDIMITVLDEETNRKAAIKALAKARFPGLFSRDAFVSDFYEGLERNPDQRRKRIIESRREETRKAAIEVDHLLSAGFSILEKKP